MSESGPRALAETLVNIARQFEAEPFPETTQNRVTQAAVTTIDGCDHAAISIIRRRGGVETVAATDDVATAVDAIQYETRQGPCLTAIYEHANYLIDDLADDQRWPAFSHRAVTETGIRWMLSFRLFLQGDTLGALNMYSLHPAAFDEHAAAVGTMLAAYAAIAMAAAREHQRAEHLQEALRSSREIGMAIGVLMNSGKIAQDEAFTRLRQASQDLHRKLREVATEVVDTGELPRRSERTRGG